MSAITRAELAERAHEELDLLGSDLSLTPDGNRTEGDYTYPIDYALRDCGLESVDEVSTGAYERAVLAGVLYYAARRIWNRRGVNVSKTQGVGAAGRRDQDWNGALNAFNAQIKRYREDYEQALGAVGGSLGGKQGAGESAVNIDDDDPLTKLLVDAEPGVGKPWFREGYAEVS